MGNSTNRDVKRFLEENNFLRKIKMLGMKEKESDLLRGLIYSDLREIILNWEDVPENYPVNERPYPWYIGYLGKKLKKFLEIRHNNCINYFIDAWKDGVGYSELKLLSQLHNDNEMILFLQARKDGMGGKDLEELVKLSDGNGFDIIQNNCFRIMCVAEKEYLFELLQQNKIMLKYYEEWREDKFGMQPLELPPPIKFI